MNGRVQYPYTSMYRDGITFNGIFDEQVHNFFFLEFSTRVGTIDKNIETSWSSAQY